MCDVNIYKQIGISVRNKLLRKIFNSLERKATRINREVKKGICDKTTYITQRKYLYHMTSGSRNIPTDWIVSTKTFKQNQIINY